MSKALKYALLIVLASVLVLMLRVPLGIALHEYYDSQFLGELIAGSAIRLLLILGLLYFVVKKGFLPFNGLYPSFTVTNLFLFFISIAIILVLAYSSYEVYLQAKPGKLMLFGLSNVLIGVFEELLFRGIVFPLLIIHFAGKKQSILKAAYLSAILFGLIHLIGLIRHPEKVYTIINIVIYAIGIGFLFACLLLRTRNILIPALLHALVDFTNAANDLSEEVTATTEPTLSTIVLTLTVVTVMSGIFIGIGLFLFKQVEQEEWIQKAALIKL